MDNGTKSEQNMSPPDIKPLNAVIENESESFHRPFCEKKRRSEIIKLPNQAKEKKYVLFIAFAWHNK